jgi:hypothetical protein
LLDHLAHPLESVWLSLPDCLRPPLRFDSLIISGIPEIFAQFPGKRILLLWRGNPDGFSCGDIHARCDEHANTLTVILDTDGNVFGGFTPVDWESRTSNYTKADNSLRSFLFTLKNPHNIPARRFALKAEEKSSAIGCDSEWGPYFGCDIGVSSDCNAGSWSYISLGRDYTNDTGLDGRTVFTGSYRFQVKEIEVFEIRE